MSEQEGTGIGRFIPSYVKGYHKGTHYSARPHLHILFPVLPTSVRARLRATQFFRTRSVYRRQAGPLGPGLPRLGNLGHDLRQWPCVWLSWGSKLFVDLKLVRDFSLRLGQMWPCHFLTTQTLTALNLIKNTVIKFNVHIQQWRGCECFPHLPLGGARFRGDTQFYIISDWRCSWSLLNRILRNNITNEMIR